MNDDLEHRDDDDEVPSPDWTDGYAQGRTDERAALDERLDRAEWVLAGLPYLGARMEVWRTMNESERAIVALRDAVLLGEKWARSMDPNERRNGADLLQVLGADERSNPLTPENVTAGLRYMFSKLGAEVDDASIKRAARAVIREVAHTRSE